MALGFLALYLSSFLRGSTELVLDEDFRGVAHYFLAGLSGPYFGLVFLGIPAIIFSYTNYKIWQWLSKN